MFLRANVGKEMGFALAQPCQLGNLRFPRRETRWPGFFFLYGVRYGVWTDPFFRQKPKKAIIMRRRVLLEMLLGQGSNLWRLACCVLFFH
jgi:hypothetical protein